MVDNNIEYVDAPAFMRFLEQDKGIADPHERWAILKQYMASNPNARIKSGTRYQGPADTGQLFDTHGKPIIGKFGQRDAARMAGNALGALPTVGGVAGDIGGMLAAAALAPESGGGSLLTAPALMAGGSGLGQAAGRGLELMGRHALGMPTPQNVPMDLLGQAGIGAGTSLVGQGLSNAVVKPVAGMLMHGALRTADRAAVDAALKEGIRPGRSLLTGKTGMEQVAARKAAAQEAQKAALAREGGGMDPTPVLNKLESMVQDLEHKARLAPELTPDATALRNRVDAFKEILGNGPIHPEDVQTMKQIYAEMAKPGYMAAQKGGAPIPMTQAQVKYSKIVADEMRAWLKENLGAKYTKPTKTLERLMALGPKMALAEKNQHIPGLGMAFNATKVLPKGLTGQAALDLYGKGAPVARWAPWLLNYPISTGQTPGQVQ